MSARSFAHRRPNATAFAGVFAATLLCFFAVGAVLPILPRYVIGPLDGGDVEVGIVTGAFAFTAIIGRPVGGRIADRRGRRLVVLCGLLLSATAGVLYLVSSSVAGLVFARLVLGWGDGWVFTAGLAWTVDLAPEHRRGQAIAMYGLGVWGGLAIGPVIGEGLYSLGGFDAVWIFAAISPALGALVARIVPDRRALTVATERPPLLPRAALRPGTALFLANVGYATLAGFVVLHIDGGAAVFTAFAVTVVVARLALSRLPDRLGARRTAAAAGVAQAVGLGCVALADAVPLAFVGALFMGAGFSLSFPSLALLVIEEVDEEQRGAAMGGFSAFFDLGVGIGAPLAGAISALAGYGAAFGAAAVAAALGVVVIARSATPSGLTGLARPSPDRPRR